MDPSTDEAIPHGRPRRRLPRTMVLLGGVVAAAALFAGCIQVEIGVRVDEDGSGEASMLFAFNEQLLEFIASLDEEGEDFDPEEVFSDIDEDELPEGAKVEQYRKDGFVGARLTAPFKGVDELPALLDRMAGGVALPGDQGLATGDGPAGGFERFKLERTSEGWRLDAVAEALGSGEEDLGGDEFGAELLEDASFTIKIKLPGTVKEHNADEEDGGELTWRLDLESTEPRELMAVTSTSGDGAPWVLVGGVAAGLVGLGAIGWDLNRRRRGRISSGTA